MRCVVLVPIVLLMASCGPSQAELDLKNAQAKLAADAITKKKQDDAAAAATAAYNDCLSKKNQADADRTKQIAQDQDTIKVALDDIDRSGSNDDGQARYRLAIAVGSLDSPEWKWVEGEDMGAATYDSASARFDKISYTVDPSRLNSSVEATTYLGMPAIRFTCNYGNCIHAFGRRVTSTIDSGDSFTDVDEMRSDNYWVFGTMAKAQVAADRMTDLLRQLSASSAICTPPSGPGGEPTGNTM